MFEWLKENHKYRNHKWTDIHPHFSHKHSEGYFFAYSYQTTSYNGSYVTTQNHNVYEYKIKTYEDAWKDCFFTYPEAQQWIEVGMCPEDLEIVQSWRRNRFTAEQFKSWTDLGIDKKYGANFSKFLRSKGFSPEKFHGNNKLEQLRVEYADNTNDWSTIHESFGGKIIFWFDDEKQKRWKKEGFSAREVREWIIIGIDPKNSFNAFIAKKWKNFGFSALQSKEWIYSGFSFNDHQEVSSWKNLGFTALEAKKWKEISLKNDEYELAYYLKKEGFNPQKIRNLEILRERFDNFLTTILKKNQDYLNYFYPFETRKSIKSLNISKGYWVPERKKLTGNLDLTDFSNLQYLDCSNNKLNVLNTIKCKNLVTIICFGNQLKTLLLPEGLTHLNASNNQIADLSLFNHLNQLRTLSLEKNPAFIDLKKYEWFFENLNDENLLKRWQKHNKKTSLKKELENSPAQTIQEETSTCTQAQIQIPPK